LLIILFFEQATIDHLAKSTSSIVDASSGGGHASEAPSDAGNSKSIPTEEEILTAKFQKAQENMNKKDHSQVL
jgi:hypothetical protein